MANASDIRSNRTFMELKYEMIELIFAIVRSSNRTFMELKLSLLKKEIKPLLRSNRTFMELKLFSSLLVIIL